MKNMLFTSNSEDISPLNKIRKSPTIIIIITEVGNARLGESDRHSQSDDPSPTKPTHRKKDENEKIVKDKRVHKKT